MFQHNCFRKVIILLQFAGNFLIITKIPGRQLYLEVFVVWIFVNQHGKIKAKCMWFLALCFYVFFIRFRGQRLTLGGQFLILLSCLVNFFCCIKGKRLLTLGDACILRPLPGSLPIICVFVCMCLCFSFKRYHKTCSSPCKT